MFILANYPEKNHAGNSCPTFCWCFGCFFGCKRHVHDDVNMRIIQSREVIIDFIQIKRAV